MKMKFEAKLTISMLLMMLLLAGTMLALKTPLVESSNGSSDPVLIYKDLTQLSTGHEEEAPSIALDHNGNLHVVWIGNDTANLYYMMVDPYGNTLINETVLDPSSSASSGYVRRASIGVDSDNNVHIVFHSQYYPNRTALDVQEVLYLKINPYLDDLDGSAADSVTVTVIPETIISTDDSSKSRAANLAVDATDNVHVAWFDNDTWNEKGELHYLVMDAAGGVVVSEKNVTAGFYTDVDWSEPEIVVDSQGNAHVFFVTQAWTNTTRDWRDIWYTMLEGSTGNVLINNTQLTNSSETWRHSRPFVDIDFKDKIHIAWHDSRFDENATGEHEIFYVKIEPYLDDRDGDSADPDELKVIKETLISDNDFVKSFLTNIAVDQYGMAHLAWLNDDDYQIYYALVNTAGDLIIPETGITANGALDFTDWYWSSNRNPEIAVENGRIFVVDMAANTTTSDCDVWLTIAFVDKAPPSTAISYDAYFAEGRDWLTNTSLVSLSAVDHESAILGTYYRIDGGSWHTYGQPFTLSSLADGSHKIKYYSVDNFGNEEAAKEQMIYLDSTPPEIHMPTRDPSGDVEEGQPVDISVSIEDIDSGIDDSQVILSYTLTDGASWTSTEMTYNSATDLYEATIPEQFNCTWTKYLISASDNVDNTGAQDNDGSYYAYHTIKYDVTEDPLYQELLELKDTVTMLSQQNADLADEVDTLSEQNANLTDKTDSVAQNIGTMSLQLLGTSIVIIILVAITLVVIFMSKRRSPT